MMYDWFNNDVALALTIWQITAFIPQYRKIIKTRSSVGHHCLFLFLGHIASGLAWINALIYYLFPWRHCQEEGTELGCVQIYGLGFYFLQWVLYLIWVLLYLGFLSNVDEHVVRNNELFVIRAEVEAAGYICYFNKHRRKMYYWFGISILGLLGCFLTTVYLIRKHSNDLLVLENINQLDSFHRLAIPSELMHWSLGMETIVLIFMSLHYLPQLWELVRLGRIGSYSLVSLAMMIPANVVWTVFLSQWSFLVDHHPRSPADLIMNITVNSTIGERMEMAPSAWDRGVSLMQIWIPYLITAISQVITLIFGGYYYYYEGYIDIEWYN